MGERFNLKEFRAVRKTSGFQMWSKALQDSSQLNEHLRRLGQEVILPQFVPWNEPPMAIKSEGLYVETTEGKVRDWGPIAYWTKLFPPKRFPACLYNVLHPPAVELALRLLHLSGMDMIAYGISGSSSVDISIKLSMQYQHHLGHPKRKKICMIRGGYHGSTGLDLYISGNPDYESLNDSKYLPSVDWVVRLPDVAKKREWFRAFDKIDFEKTAAFIYELIQGVRGIYSTFDGIKYIMPIAKKNGILMIADEISTAPAKTGRMFASEYLDEMPNIILFGKGITNGEEILSGVLIDQETAEVIRTFREFYYGYCFGGHPEACRKSLEVLNMLEQMDAPAFAQSMGTYFLRKLKEFEVMPEIVEARGIGLMLGIEFENSTHAKGVKKELLKLGELVGSEGNTIAIKPPFFVTHDDIDSFCVNLRKAIENYLVNNL